MTTTTKSPVAEDDNYNEETGHTTSGPRTTHTGLPWQLYDDDGQFTIKSMWSDANKPENAEGYGDYRGITICEIEHQGESAPVVTKRQAEANAVYIVKACNAFPEAIALLNRAASALSPREQTQLQKDIEAFLENTK